MSTDPTYSQDSARSKGGSNPVVLAGGLVGAGLAAVAVVLFLTRVQPAPEPNPAPKPNSVAVAAPTPEEVPLPAPPSQLGAPGEVTTIVLEDPAASGDAPQPWDGKSARGLEDGPIVLNAAIAAAGGEQVLPALSRFTARFATSQPMYAAGELAFDATQGIALRRADLHLTIARNKAGDCVQWRSEQRVAASCTLSQAALMGVLWQAARSWALGPLKQMTITQAYLTGVLGKGSNTVGFQLPDAEAGGKSAIIASFEVASGTLQRAVLPLPTGLAVARFANQRPTLAGASGATEWTIFAPRQSFGLNAKEAPTKEQGADHTIHTRELAEPQIGFYGPLVLNLHSFRGEVDKALFDLPKPEARNRASTQATLRPDVPPANLLPIAINADGGPDETAQAVLAGSWVAAMADWVAVVEEGKPLRLGIGLRDGMVLPPELQKTLQRLPVDGAMAGAALPIGVGGTATRKALADLIGALGRKGTGPMYVVAWATGGGLPGYTPDIIAFGSASMLLEP